MDQAYKTSLIIIPIFMVISFSKLIIFMNQERPIQQFQIACHSSRKNFMPFFLTLLVLKVNKVGSHVKKNFLFASCLHYFSVDSPTAMGVSLKNRDHSLRSVAGGLTYPKRQAEPRDATANYANLHLIKVGVVLTKDIKLNSNKYDIECIINLRSLHK